MSLFRIAAPFASIDEIEPLKEAGVSELCCGYIDEESEKLWPICFTTIKPQSFKAFSVFEAAVKKAERCHLPVYVMMHGLYTAEQYPWLIKTIRRISKLKGVKGLVVSDMGLLATLRGMNYRKEMHISTIGTIFNSRAADFFHSLGASRVVLDRQLSSGEIARLISKKRTDIGIQIYLFGAPCFFVDGHCSLSHCLNEMKSVQKAGEDLTLMTTYNTRSLGCAEFKEMLARKKYQVHPLKQGQSTDTSQFQSRHYSLHCNLCNLYELKDFSGIILKITGQMLDQMEAVKTVSAAIKMLDRKNMPRDRFLKEMKQLYFSLCGEECQDSQCYYPALKG